MNYTYCNRNIIRNNTIANLKNIYHIAAETPGQKAGIFSRVNGSINGNVVRDLT